MVASLTGFDTAISATATALSSAGSAQAEFDKSLDSIKKKAEGTKGAIMELAWGNGGLKNLISAFLDGSTGVLRFINDTKALNVVLVAMGVALMANVIPAIVRSISSIITFTTAILSNTVAMEAMGVSINTVKIALGGITAVLGIAYMAWNAYNSAQEENARIRKEQVSNTISQIKTMDSAIESLKSETLTREALNQIVESNISGYADEISQISDLNDARQTAIDKIKEEQNARAKEVANTGLTSYQEAKFNQTQSTSKFKYTPYSNIGQEYFDTMKNASGTQEQIDAITEYKNQVVALREEVEEGSFDYNQYTKAISASETELAKLYETQKEDTATIYEFDNALSSIGKKYDENTGKIRDMNDKEIESAKAKTDTKDVTNSATVSEEDYAQAVTASAEAQEEANQALEDSVSQISSISDNYSTLSSAVDEYNASGALSFETLDKLMSLGGDYLSLLTMENGQLTLNKEGFNALANAKIDTAEMTAYNKAMTDLEAISIQDAGNASAEASGKIISAGDSAYISGVNALNSVGKWNSFWGAILNEKGVKADNEQGKKIGSSLKAQLTALEGARKSIGKYASATGKSAKATGKSAKATGGATKATKSHTDALKEQQKALKAQQKALQDTVDKYEKVIAYINSKVDDQIDKLKDLKDTALDAIDAQITALEDQRDAEEDLWNDKIDALNAQNDALEDQIKLEQLLQALALAQSKKVRIFREGKGFVYESDQSAVSEAQKDLAEYNRQAKLKAQVKELELARDAMLAVYNKQISDLEAYKKSVEASYDAQIKYYEDWKDKFKEQTDAFEDEQNRLLALQLTGIDFENQNWTTRLGNLSNFVNQYRAYQQQLADLTAQINASAESAGDDGGETNNGGSSKSASPKTPTAKKVSGYQGKVKYTGKYPVSYNGSTYRTGQTATFKGASPQDVASQIARFIRACGKSYANQIGGITAYAKGVASVTGDQMAITGEGSNRELVLGSKANGTLTKLDNGGGVVNAKSLKTFAGILNTIGASGMTGRTSSQISNTSNSNSQVVNIANITLPEVKDPQGFTNWLSDFNNNMTRRSYSNA